MDRHTALGFTALIMLWTTHFMTSSRNSRAETY